MKRRSSGILTQSKIAKLTLLWTPATAYKKFMIIIMSCLETAKLKSVKKVFMLNSNQSTSIVRHSQLNSRDKHASRKSTK